MADYFNDSSSDDELLALAAFTICAVARLKREAKRKKRATFVRNSYESYRLRDDQLPRRPVLPHVNRRPAKPNQVKEVLKDSRAVRLNQGEGVQVHSRLPRPNQVQGLHTNIQQTPPHELELVHTDEESFSGETSDRVCIASQLERWRAIKSMLNIEEDEQFAQLLIDSFYTAQGRHAKPRSAQEGQVTRHPALPDPSVTALQGSDPALSVPVSSKGDQIIKVKIKEEPADEFCTQEVMEEYETYTDSQVRWSNIQETEMSIKKEPLEYALDDKMKMESRSVHTPASELGRRRSACSRYWQRLKEMDPDRYAVKLAKIKARVQCKRQAKKVRRQPESFRQALQHQSRWDQGFARRRRFASARCLKRLKETDAWRYAVMLARVKRIASQSRHAARLKWWQRQSACI